MTTYRNVQQLGWCLGVAAAALLVLGVTTPVQAQPTINELQKLLAGDGDVGDEFGFSVSISGDTAIVGAYQDDDNGSSSGSAYIFVWNGTTWVQQAKLLPSDGTADDRFGASVSISGDTAIVGAFVGTGNATYSGSAYIFEKGTGWTNGSGNQTAKLFASDGAASDKFGYWVSISGDTAIVGAYYDDDNGSDSGSAYVFEKGAGWADMTETGKLLPSDGAGNDRFGWSVSISGDTAVIGAYFNDDNGSDSGSAYIFEKPVGGWVNMTETAKLLASDAAANDQFGGSVSISGDTAIVGANWDASLSGSAYIFEKGTGWTNGSGNQTAKLLASDAASGDRFGSSVSISGDTAIVGAPRHGDNASNSGSAYIFEKPVGGWVNMTQTAKLLASDGAVSNNFGNSVSISGVTAIVGAFRDENYTGSAYIFPPICTPTLTLTATDTCVAAGEQLVVNVDLDVDGECPTIVGGQYLLDYDNTLLDFVSADAAGVWTDEVYEDVDEAAGTIAYATGIPSGSGATSGTMATLTFDVLTDSCSVTALVAFRAQLAGEPAPTTVTDENDDEYNDVDGTLTVVDTATLTLDITDPAITTCPTDLNLFDDGSGCNDTDPGMATATDNCDTNVDITWVRSDGVVVLNDPFCVNDSPITITWTATDDCGNTDVCVQTITVAEVVMTATVQLEGNYNGASFTRCITFDLLDCDTNTPETSLTIEAEFTFAAGLNPSATQAITVGPGNWSCVSAKDRFHTLMKTKDIADSNNLPFSVDFTIADDDDALVSGNFNDNDYIDIVDFAIFVNRFGDNPGPDTLCPTPGTIDSSNYHPDASGDGLIGTEDFTFVSANFFAVSEAACTCPVGAPGGGGRPGIFSTKKPRWAPRDLTPFDDGPLASISVIELYWRGQGELAVADLNGDGWVDQLDIVEVLNGNWPK